MATQRISRRGFVSAIPLTVLVAPSYLSACEARADDEAEPKPILNTQLPGFAGQFSPEEAEAVAGSAMAREIAGLNGKGYPCSEMMLLAALRRFGLSENHLDAAAVFGGGVGKRDLCGFLTGGLMAIGFVVGDRHEDRSKVHQVGRKASNQYWEWWMTRGDLHCMAPGTTHENSEEFVRMAQRCAVKLEGILLEVAQV
jgi:C_GCAxxG_C_C family probable redox protein